MTEFFRYHVDGSTIYFRKDVIMESAIVSSIVQAGSISPESWLSIHQYWQWSFWIGFFVGVVGVIVGFFFRPVEGP